MRIPSNSKRTAAQPALITGQQGMALILVLVFSAALMVLGSALISFAVNEKLITTYSNSNIRLYYLAEAGIEAAIALLQEDSTFTGTINGQLNGGTYQADINSSDQSAIIVRSRASLGKYDKYLTVILEVNEEGQVKINKWQKASAIKPAGY